MGKISHIELKLNATKFSGIHPDTNCRDHIHTVCKLPVLVIYFDEHLNLTITATFIHCNKRNKSLHCINKTEDFLNSKPLIILYLRYTRTLTSRLYSRHDMNINQFWNKCVFKNVISPLTKMTETCGFLHTFAKGITETKHVENL